MQQIPIAKDEFIGRAVIISDCTDPTWVQRTGRIIDETKHTFLIQTTQGRKRIAKQTATFTFPDERNTVSIKGSTILFRAEERIKKAR